MIESVEISILQSSTDLITKHPEDRNSGKPRTVWVNTFQERMRDHTGQHHYQTFWG